MSSKIVFLLAALVTFLFFSCDSEKVNAVNKKTEAIEIPSFNAEYAYDLVQKQVDFGPRVPETESHAACAEWLKAQLNAYGWKTDFQSAEVDGYDGKRLNIKNIVASFKPDHKFRVLLCAHWDTRRIADQDTTRKNEPILGADDGGSGVAILLELARVIAANDLNMGVEIVLFDAEDQGESSSASGQYRKETWCIGSQYWSKNPHPMQSKPYMGILLDMVGSKGARFPREGLSTRHAKSVLDKVWLAALDLGYSDLFVNSNFNELVDDHLFVNDIAKIPTIDIINLPTNPAANGTFGHYWHTHRDNMSVIDKNTLGAVGRVLLKVLFEEAS